LQVGHDLALVSKRVGHAGVGITADVYGHVDAAKDQKAAEVLDSTGVFGRKMA
jgi:integrase